MEPCPHESCDDSFETERGLKSHWGRMHEKPAPWKVWRCAHCGELFERPPSQIQNDNPTCSYSCANQIRERGTNKVTVSCDNCGDSLSRYPSHVNETNFCSMECNGEWMSRLPVEDAPAYKGGGRDKQYGAKWRQAREVALERDGSCTYEGCGKTECDDGRSLHVHHIKPARTFDDYEDAHRPENLRVVCATHHSEIEP